jgi:Protein of unknown function (DUF2752)
VVGFALPVVIRCGPEDRLRNLLSLGMLLAWLAYTRFWWALQVSHLAFPTCPFLRLTGHPCPFCGGTRSFAYIWQGDLFHAVRMYPLSPALFVVLVAAIGLLVWGLLKPRDIHIPGWLGGTAAVVGVAAVAVNWTLKLTVLPN